MTDDPTQAEQQEEIENAATAPGHLFHGARLQPFSFDRNACWQRCGYDRFESSFEALVAIVYFCTLGDEIMDGKLTGWDVMDSCRGPEAIKAMRRRIGAWCDANGINGNSDEGVAVSMLGMAIWKEIGSSKFAPEKKGAVSPNG